MESKNITGQIIKALRREKHLKMYELGEAIGVSKSCISNYESGYNIPSRENLMKLSELFDVNIDYLLGKTELRDRFLKYIKGMMVPIFENDDIESLVNFNESKIAGIINIPRYNNVENDLKETFAVKVEDNTMNFANIIPGGYAIGVRDDDMTKNGIAVIVYNKKIYIRRLHIFENHVTLIPDSYDKTHMPLQVEKSDVKMIGYIKSVVHNVN
jgi:repressor LexA